MPEEEDDFVVGKDESGPRGALVMCFAIGAGKNTGPVMVIQPQTPISFRGLLNSSDLRIIIESEIHSIHSPKHMLLVKRASQ